MNKMTQEQIDKATEIFNWSLENNDENFSVWVEFSGNINLMGVRVVEDGYDNIVNDGETTRILSANLNHSSDPTMELSNCLDELKKLKAESVKRNSPENKKAIQEKAKQDKIDKLKAEIKKLEG